RGLEGGRMIDAETLRDMRMRALAWVTGTSRVDGGQTIMSREDAINEQDMALDVLDLLDEVERLRATLAQPHHEWAAGQHSVGVDIAAEDKRIRDENDGLRARLAAAEAANASI